MMLRSGAFSARAGDGAPTTATHTSATAIRRSEDARPTSEIPPGVSQVQRAKGPKKDARVSRSSVTGPSLTSSTSMSARNRPVTTDTPSARACAATDSTSGSACSGGAASLQLGRRPLRQSPSSVNCETTPSASPASSERAVHHALARPRRRAGARASRRARRASLAVSPRATPTSASRPAPISADRLAADPHARAPHALRDRPHGESWSANLPR